MAFLKIEKDGYILGLAAVDGEGNVSEAEYHALADVIRSMPAAPEGWFCRLTAGMEWQLWEKPEVDESEEELPDAEALTIILGGETA